LVAEIADSGFVAVDLANSVKPSAAPVRNGSKPYSAGSTAANSRITATTAAITVAFAIAFLVGAAI
jgi:hypothetical protein